MSEPAIFFSGGILGLIVGVAFTWGITDAAMRDSHNQAVFDELVKVHGCKLTNVLRNGVTYSGSACVLPDGTIHERAR